MMVNKRLEQLAKFGGAADGGVTREAFSQEAMQAAEWLRSEMESAGLETHLDSVGNVIGVWNVGEGAAVALGSHYDTVKEGGRFDGALGVVGAISAVENLRKQGLRPRRPAMVIGFNAEDWSQSPMFGSHAFCGDADVEFQIGQGVPQIMESAGFCFDQLSEANQIKSVCAFLELHVEQGPVLENKGVDIGIVTGVVGSLIYKVAFLGEANHAGTTPLNLRRDALLGAAEAILSVRRLGEEHDARTTVGKMSVDPGAINIIPGRAEFYIDVRSTNKGALQDLGKEIPEEMNAIAAKHELTCTLDVLLHYDPHQLDKSIQETMRETSSALGLTSYVLPSGASHDARNISLNGVPSGIVFVPSSKGISHSSEEFTSPEQCEAGVKVLQGVLEHLLMRETY